jgi:hypothetical protein
MRNWNLMNCVLEQLLSIVVDVLLLLDENKDYYYYYYYYYYFYYFRFCAFFRSILLLTFVRGISEISIKFCVFLYPY